MCSIAGMSTARPVTRTQLLFSLSVWSHMESLSTPVGKRFRLSVFAPACSPFVTPCNGSDLTILNVYNGCNVVSGDRPYPYSVSKTIVFPLCRRGDFASNLRPSDGQCAIHHGLGAFKQFSKPLPTCRKPPKKSPASLSSVPASPVRCGRFVSSPRPQPFIEPSHLSAIHSCSVTLEKHAPTPC